MFFFAPRYATLRLVRIVGTISCWLLRGWRLLFIGWAVTACVIWLVAQVLPKYSAALLDFWIIVTFYCVALIFFWVWQVRRHVVIESFTDYTGQYKEEAPGLAILLVSNLQALGELYRDVDERRAVTTRVEAPKGAVNATIKVEDVGAILKGAVSAESKLGLGPISIPVGAILALLGRLVQGPRVIGSIHRDSGSLTLTALLTGPRQSAAWRVDRPIPVGADSKDELPRLGDIVEELTYRVFSETALGASVRWRATKTFCEGLRKYRDCLITPKNRTLHLRQAQYMFVEALSEDENFNLCYYNLGVVALELGESEAARESFLKAIQLNPELWEGYYALALYDGDALNVISLCDRMISLKQDSAQAYNLKGIAQRRPPINDIVSAVSNRERAVMLAWNQLLRTELFGKQLSKTRVQSIATYLRNLAIGYSYQADDETIANRQKKCLRNRAVGLLRLGAKLDPSNVDNYLELGKIINFFDGSTLEALNTFETAVRLDPRNLESWSYVSLLRALNNRPEEAIYACGKVLGRASEASPDIIDRIADAYDRLDAPDEANRIRSMGTFPGSLSSLDIEALKEKLKECQSDGLDWEAGHIAAELGRRFLNEKQFEKAADQFWTAIQRLEARYPGEIDNNDLHVKLANCLRQQKRWENAVNEIKRGLQQDASSVSAHYERVQICFGMEDLPGAETCLREALLWHPQDASLHWLMGVCHWHIALQHHGKPNVRKSKLQQAVPHFLQSLDLEFSDTGKALVHYWLGKLYTECGEYALAVSHLRIVKAGEFAIYLPALFLGAIYLRSASYNECEEEFSGLIDRLNARFAAGDPTDILLDESLQDGYKLGLVLVWSYWGLCYSRALRGVRLQDSLSILEAAFTIANRVDDKGSRDSCLAALLHCKGWLQYKLDHIEEALSTLQESVSISADSEAYLHLGLIYERATRTHAKNEIPLLIDRARECAQHSQSLDAFGTYVQDALELITRLEKINSNVEPALPAPEMLEPTPKPPMT
jgi:tetratricopeptide (TPR) repeat protein